MKIYLMHADYSNGTHFDSLYFDEVEASVHADEILKFFEDTHIDAKVFVKEYDLDKVPAGVVF